MTKPEEAAQLTWRADRLRGQADHLDREAARLLLEAVEQKCADDANRA